MKTSIYTYVKTDRVGSNGEYDVYLLVKNGNGKFMVNTGLTSPGKLIGNEFPRGAKNGKVKTNALRRYMMMAEEILLRPSVSEMSNAELKALIQRDVFGIVSQNDKTLAYYIEMYAQEMKASTKRLYTLTADRVREYGDDTPDRISKTWLDGFEGYLRSRGLSVNGIGQKMRNIRAVMNWCIDEGVTQNYPFRGRRGYKIKEESKPVNNLSAQEFADLRDYPCEEWQRKYVDLFCLSTYLGGVNAGDLLLCKGLTKGRFVYVRRKTDKVNAQSIQSISIPVCKEAMAIINKYKGKDYLLDVMDGMTDYHTFVQHWNKALKKIGEVEVVPDKVGKLRKLAYKPLFPSLTTYSARYTFASVAANELDISEAVVAKCLGHSWSKQVTARYISHDQKKIDDAVFKVVEHLNKFKGRYNPLYLRNIFRG